MSVRDDPLLAARDPDRVFYAAGMLLDAADFEAEQLYHRGRLARALLYLHGSGTVAGLRVDRERASDGAERVLVRPGMAIDRVGRVIEVGRDVCLRLDRWYDQQSAADLDAAMYESRGGVVVDVFLRFVPCERGKTPAFAQGPFDATDAFQPARLRDGFEVRLFLRKNGALGLPASEWPEEPAEEPEEGAEAPAPPDPVRRLRDLVFGQWRAREGLEPDGEPDPQGEHLPDQDPTSIFLARLTLPAERGEAGERPTRRPDSEEESVEVDNYSRRFVYPAGALARVLGLEAPTTNGG